MGTSAGAGAGAGLTAGLDLAALPGRNSGTLPLVGHVLDAPEWRWIGLNQASCGITIVRWQSDRPPTLVSFNDTGHL